LARVELGVDFLAAAGEGGGDEQVALLEFGLFGLGEGGADRRGKLLDDIFAAGDQLGAVLFSKLEGRA